MDAQQLMLSPLFKSTLILSSVFFLSPTLHADYLSEHGIYPWQAVSNDILSVARGGFVFSNGIEVDVGIQQNLSINSAEFGSQINLLNNLQNLSSASTSTVLKQQSAGIRLPLGLNIIQNSLDNLALRNTTTLDIRIKNFDTFKNPAALIPSFQNIIEPAVFQ